MKVTSKSYRYVLSVIDVFSRFVWLCALTTKCSKDISKELQTIYMEHGPPTVIQRDQGSEFKGVNWAKSLPTYQRILNHDPKEVLSHKTPFEVYFARKCKSFKTSAADNELVDNTGRINATATDRKRCCRHVSQLRQEAHKATNRCDRRMQRAKLRSNPPARYSVGEVFVRLRMPERRRRSDVSSRRK